MAMLHPNPAERLSDMTMVAERLREVIEMEAERDVLPPRPALALVPSEPEQETAVEASLGEAVAGPIGEPIAANPAAVVADVKATVLEEPAVSLVAAAAANTSRAIPPATPRRGLLRALVGGGLALALLSGVWMAGARTVPLTLPPTRDDPPAPAPTTPRAILAPERTPAERGPGAHEEVPALVGSGLALAPLGGR